MRLAAEMPERMKLRGSRTKYVLKEAMRRYLPANVLYRPKTGFGCPLRRWIGGDLKPVIEQLLHPRVVRDRGIFVPEAVSRILKEDSENREDHSFLIYAMMFLEVWMRTFIDRRAEQVTL
jgi:asparagine synthase (glutamine-hydrolysing)